VNPPTPELSLVLVVNAVVGFGVLLQQIPLAVIGDLPSNTINPPDVAVLKLILDIGLVDNDGSTGGGNNVSRTTRTESANRLSKLFAEIDPDVLVRVRCLAFVVNSPVVHQYPFVLIKLNEPEVFLLPPGCAEKLTLSVAETFGAVQLDKLFNLPPTMVLTVVGTPTVSALTSINLTNLSQSASVEMRQPCGANPLGSFTAYQL
jgi:hypothetical protein